MSDQVKTVVCNRFTSEVICEGETLVAALQSRLANLGGADLGGADLRGAYLRGAYLGGADLGGAYLGGADLGGAYLRGAYLGGADLGGAYLRGADLRDAYLRDAYLGGAYLGGAYLRGADLSWESHDLLAEILKRAAGDDIAKQKVAGLILLMKEKCWSDFMKLHDPLTEWAIDVFRGYIVDGDNHPTILDIADK